MGDNGDIYTPLRWSGSVALQPIKARKYVRTDPGGFVQAATRRSETGEMVGAGRSGAEGGFG